MRYWICVITPENYEIAIQNGIWGVSTRYKNILDQSSIGDKLIFYIIGRKLGGCFEVESKPRSGPYSLFKGGSYGHQIKIEPIFIPKKLVDFDSSVRNKLTITKNKTYWTGPFRRAMFQISSRDYKILKSAVMGSPIKSKLK